MRRVERSRHVQSGEGRLLPATDELSGHCPAFAGVTGDRHPGQARAASADPGHWAPAFAGATAGSRHPGQARAASVDPGPWRNPAPARKMKAERLSVTGVRVTLSSPSRPAPASPHSEEGMNSRILSVGVLSLGVALTAGAQEGAKSARWSGNFQPVQIRSSSVGMRIQSRIYGTAELATVEGSPSRARARLRRAVPPRRAVPRQHRARLPRRARRPPPRQATPVSEAALARPASGRPPQLPRREQPQSSGRN